MAEQRHLAICPSTSPHLAAPEQVGKAMENVCVAGAAWAVAVFLIILRNH